MINNQKDSVTRSWYKTRGGGENSATPGTFFVSESSNDLWRHIRSKDAAKFVFAKDENDVEWRLRGVCVFFIYEQTRP